jgi:membrane-bound serine protease (ClpP class)
MITEIFILAADEPNSAYLVWGLILFGVALAIVALELVIPSGGLLGLLSGGAVIASVVSFFMYSATAGIIALMTYLILTPIVIVFGLKLWMNSPLGRMVVLGDAGAVGAEEQAPAGPPAEMATAGGAARAADLRKLVGVEGTSLTPLRPVGTVKIGEHRIEALAEAGTIDRGVPVVVTEVYDNQVKVRAR